MGQERSLDEQLFRESEDRQAFLLKLSDAMRSQSDPVAVQAEVVRLLGEHLRVGHCFYCEMEPDGDHMWIREDYHNGVPSQAVFFRISGFGPFLLNEYLAGRTVVMRDAQSDTRLLGAEWEMYPMVNVRAFVCVPLVKEGRLFSVLAVNQPAPRDWMPDEIALIEEVAERTWAAVERAKAEEALRESQAQLAVEVQTMRDLHDSSTRLLGMSDLNAAFEEFLDSSMRLLGADFGNVQLYNAKHKVLELVTTRGFHPEFIEKFKFVCSDDNTACGRAARSGERIIIEDVEQDALYKPYLQDAAKADYRAVQSTPIVDRQGRLLGMLSTHFRAPHRPSEDDLRLLDLYVRQTVDFIVRVRAEEALRRSEERLRLILESAQGFAIFTTDADGVINSWYEGAAQVFGWSEAEILGQKCNVTFTLEDRAAGEPEKERETARREGISPDIRWHQRKDGSRVFINGAMHLLRDGQRNGFFKMGRDTTAERNAEEAVREHQKQLQSLNETLEQKVDEKTEEVRQLASDVINATQQERQRLSRVLHDDLQQRIYAILMQLSFLRDDLSSENDSVRKEASDIEKELAEIGKIARNLSIDLSPPILPGEGLSHAIEWLTTRMRERYGLPVELQANGPFVILDENLHVFLFNCVRELLFNVVKHAGASRAVVAVAWLDHGLQIEVRDDGKGFPDDVSEEGKVSQPGDLSQSLGLPSIRRQLSLFGGTMEINSKSGAGTQVILIVPVKAVQQADSSG